MVSFINMMFTIINRLAQAVIFNFSGINGPLWVIC